ncbi:MAG TPA: ABC transporter substrate-binding protein [bacterium]|nr:ABC transporter substrate-binding protein [bacterium]
MTDGSERWGRARVTRRQVLTAAGAAAVGVGLAPLASSWNVRVSRAAQTPVRLTRGKVVIGVLNDQSGLYADLSGKKGVEAVRMAVEDFQKQYGASALGGPIEVVDADHQNKPDLGAQKAQEMYQRDGVGMITDVDTSSVGIAVANIAAQQRQLCLNVGSATTALTNANCNKYTFHYAYDTYMLANGTGVQVTKQVGKNWYLVYPDYAFGQDMIHSFTPAIQKAGGKVLLADPSPFPGEGDFSTYMIKARTMRPLLNVMATMHAGQDVVNFVKQYNQYNLRQQGVNLAVGLLFTSDVHALGPEAFQGVLFTAPWDWNMDKQARDWSDRFLARTQVRPTFVMAGNYSATWQYLAAIQRAGTDDADRVVAALEGYRFSDFFVRNGEVRKQDHLVTHDALLGRIKAPNEVKEPWDYTTVVSRIPARDAFAPLNQTSCKMPA